MIRTQIYLPEELYQTVDVVAQRERKPKAQIIREVLEKGLTNMTQKETIGQALAKVIAIGHRYTPKNAPTDLSTNHDKYLYEDE